MDGARRVVVVVEVPQTQTLDEGSPRPWLCVSALTESGNKKRTVLTGFTLETQRTEPKLKPVQLFQSKAF